MFFEVRCKIGLKLGFEVLDYVYYIRFERKPGVSGHREFSRNVYQQDCGLRAVVIIAVLSKWSWLLPIRLTTSSSPLAKPFFVVAELRFLTLYRIEPGLGASIRLGTRVSQKESARAGSWRVEVTNKNECCNEYICHRNGAKTPLDGSFPTRTLNVVAMKFFF